MAYFPDKQQVKTELREGTTENDLSCVHVTTANFFELNVGYYRETTPRESWESNQGAFARPVPMQAPVLGEAVLKMKNYWVPYRIISPQWNDFITRSPHTPYNGNTPIIVQRMPYIAASDLSVLIKHTDISTVTTGTDEDFIDTAGIKYKLTQFGRHCVKILNQLGYQIVMDDKATELFDAMPILAYAKIYMDYYYTSQYNYLTAESQQIEALFKKDASTPYNVTVQDLLNIFRTCAYVWYSPDYFVSQWDSPTTPNIVTTSMGLIEIDDITISGNAGGGYKSQISTNNNNNNNNTPRIVGVGSSGNPQSTTANYQISQYVIDNLKKLTDYTKRMQMSVRSIDRYLARFGVTLTTEKMQRATYNGEQITKMNFGAIYSTAETSTAVIGDYAGQGNINSDGQEHTTFDYQELDEMGVIMTLFSINPKIGYYQGIDREHLKSDPETYFTGEWDNIGCMATSAAEVYVSTNGQSIYGKQAQINTVFGFLPRNAFYKVAKDRLTGDFRRTNINKGAEAWHMFRTIDETQFSSTQNEIVHSPFFCMCANDADQYNRIFNYTEDDNGDKFNIILTFNIKARIHALPLYDSYDFESEGKKIVMDGIGSKQN